MGTLFVLDDDQLFHRLIELSLSKSKPFNKVYHHYDAKELVRYLWEHRNDKANLPDIIFVDIKMPGFDGWEFLNALQNIFPTLSKKITIYVISVSVIKTDKIRAENYPIVEEFICKPISVDKLKAIALKKKIELEAQY
jgi:CheY-like chemotaxis protein